MGAFTGDPNPLPPPDVPPPDYRAETREKLKELKDSGIIGELLVSLIEVPVKAAMYLLTTFAGAFDCILAFVGEIFSKFQAEGQIGFDQLVATTLGDLLGVTIDGAELHKSFTTRGRLGPITATGAKLMENLTMESASAGGLSPEQGQRAMETFLGFVMQFAIRDANMGVITSIIPRQFRILENYQDYATKLAENLGLGRLTRLVLRPFVDVLIATPYQWKLNKDHRPALLGISQQIAAELAGDKTRLSTPELLARLGNDNADFNAIFETTIKHLDASDLARLERWKRVTRDQSLKMRAWELEGRTTANLRLDSQLLSRLDSKAAEFVNELEKAVVDGFLDPFAFRQKITNLGLSQDEITLEAAIVGSRIENPAKRLSLSQMREAFFSGIIDLFEFREFVRLERFSDRDQQILVFQLLNDSVERVNKQKAADFAAQVREGKLLQSARRKISSIVGLEDGLPSRDPDAQELVNAIATGQLTCPELTAFLGASAFSPEERAEILNVSGCGSP